MSLFESLNPEFLVPKIKQDLGTFLSDLSESISPLNKDSFQSSFINGISGGSIDLSNTASSLVNKFTESAPTGREQVLMDWQDYNRTHTYQDTVKDMESAGLNSALMYGNSAQPVPSSSQPSAGSGMSMSDMLALLSLPAQLANLKAQTRATNAQAHRSEADTHYIETKTLTEESNARIRAIIAEFQPAMSAEALAKLSADIDEVQSHINERVANIDFIHSRERAQNIINDVLSEKLRSEINSKNAAAAQAAASAAFTKVQCDFASEHKVLMSSSDTAILATYIAHLFGTTPEKLVSGFQDYVDNELHYDLNPWKKISADDAFSWYLKHDPRATEP